MSATEELTQKLLAHKTGEFTSLMLHLGIQLGLIEAMRGRDAVGPEELASATGLHPRWVLEWLRQQTTAGLLEYVDEERFALTDDLAAILLDADRTDYIGWMFGPPLVGAGIDRLAEAFRTGIGMSWDDHGQQGAHMVATSTLAQHRLLASEILPKMDDVVDRLRAGGKAVDVGCGAGVAICELARAFPEASFLGIDPSPTAVERARERAAEAGLENVELRVASAEDLDGSSDFDFAMVLDCMHDMTRPQEAADAIRRAMADDGTWLLKDVKCGETLRENLEHPMAAMLYGVSIAFCMSSAMAEPEGAGLGTMGFTTGTAREMAAKAGFSRFRVIEYDDDPMNLFYEVRP